MFNKLFDSILYSDLTAGGATNFNLDWGMLLVCMLIAVVIGTVVAAVYRFTSRRPSRNVMASLVMLPAVVTVIIPLANQNLGIGLAMAGIFSLVRFRSFPGNARDITLVFLAVACGLLCGTGFVTMAGVTALLGCILTFATGRIKQEDGTERDRELRITIPESLNYTEVFSDLLLAYTEKCRLTRVKTTNMGAMYELRYAIRLKEEDKEKELIDELRVRNGNLPILCAAPAMEEREEL